MYTINPQLSTGLTVEKLGSATMSNFCKGKSTPRYDWIDNKDFSILSYSLWGKIKINRRTQQISSVTNRLIQIFVNFRSSVNLDAQFFEMWVGEVRAIQQSELRNDEAKGERRHRRSLFEVVNHVIIFAKVLIEFNLRENQGNFSKSLHFVRRLDRCVEKRRVVLGTCN